MGRVTEGWMKRNQDGKQKNHCLDLGRRGGGGARDPIKNTFGQSE